MADAVFRFLSTPRGLNAQNLLLIRQAGGCGGGTELTVATPFLQVRVLIVENISSNAVQLGDFDVRRCKPSPGQSAIRNSTENARTLADAALESMPLYKRRGQALERSSSYQSNSRYVMVAAPPLQRATKRTMMGAEE